MKLRAALFALVLIVAVGVGSSQATITPSALTVSAAAPYAYVKPGSTPTLYYSAHAGSVTVTVNDTTDSSPLAIDFPDVFGDDPAPGPTASHTYTWTASATDSGTKTVALTDAGADSKSHDFAVAPDTTPPSGQSVALSGGPNYGTAFVPLVLANGTDAGAGVDPSSGVVERASATLTGSTCGTFGAYAPVTLTLSGGDATVAGGNCYRYQYKISDFVGNQSGASAPSAVAIVSTTGPVVVDTAPTEITGAGDQFWSSTADTLFFRPTANGSFTLNATATDLGAGITQVAFPDVSTTAGWAGSTGGIDTSSPYSSPVVYTWTSGAAAPGAKTVTATNSAAATATDTITISGDSTPPSGQAVTLTGGPWFSSSVPLTLAPGTDAGAGIDASRTTVERASAPVTNGVCGTFGAYAAVTLTGGSDATVIGGNCYRYQSKATDNVGNVSTASAPSGDAKIDKTAPTIPSLLFSDFSNMAAAGSTVYFRPGGSGSFTVTAAASDPESGIASYSFPAIAGFTAVGTGPQRTYAANGAAAAASGPLSVTATNAAGVTSSLASFSLVPDAKAPTLAVHCNGGACRKTPYAKTVMLTFAATDLAGSGVGTIRWTTDGTDPRVNHGNVYVRGIPLQGLTHLKIRAFDKAGNASPLVALTVNSLARHLFVAAPLSVVVTAKAGSIQARLASTRRALVTATMTGGGLRKPLSWHFVLASGTSIVQLRLPGTIKRPGSYRLVWAVTADAHKTQKTTRVTLR